MGWPECQKVQCEQPPLVDNGMVEIEVTGHLPKNKESLFHFLCKLFQGTTHFESTALYTCDPGYRLLGPASLTCSSQGRWVSLNDSSNSNPSTDATALAPLCAPWHCPEPDPVPGGHGQVEWTGLEIGGVATYACAERRTLRGAERIHCGEQGTWEEEGHAMTPARRYDVRTGIVEEKSSAFVFNNFFPFSLAGAFCHAVAPQPLLRSTPSPCLSQRTLMGPGKREKKLSDNASRGSGKVSRGWT